MEFMNKNSHKGFKIGLISFSLLIIQFFIIPFLYSKISESTIDFLSGFLIFLSGIFSIYGVIKSIKGIKEPFTNKKIVGILLNVGILLFFLYAIIMNIVDLLKII